MDCAKKGKMTVQENRLRSLENCCSGLTTEMHVVSIYEKRRDSPTQTEMLATTQRSGTTNKNC